ncbi:pyrimidine utilization protein D [Sphingomonas sp. AR_OL41]|jgi:aminoacrylate hydrolase|uniref:pyrimidine utilization protein D n=1 Tax=Sphingomonas sp. AR_OL41 TaxID=3042729 RepID=UPI0024818FBF|nr:pyrimidine utilization protein D [Sphingomonas sp. AR_OL41]MDH7970900.1 pyrimidine utilization protein D [Sphingomonas sp. AR_OL41]
MPEAAGLYYEEHGRADGTPLILSAGLGGSGNYWSPNLDALARYHRVVLYDHRGTGRSDRALPDHVTVAQMGEDLLALIDALAVERAHIVGHAAGGVAALALALKAPERIARMVLVNAWSRGDPHFARCFDTRLALLRDSGPRAYLHAQPIFLYPAAWISANADRLDEEEEVHLAHFAGAEAYEKRIAALRAFDVDARLASVAVPTLVIGAADDMLVPVTCSQRLAEGIPGAALATMAWGGHACNVTDPARFNKLVLDFLRS